MILETKTKRDWACFLEKIAKEYKKVNLITLVMDNLNTHVSAALYETFPPEKSKLLWDRFKSACTPKYGNWPNMAEIVLNVLSGQYLNRRIGNISDVKNEVFVWQKDRNSKNAKINWQFTTNDARIKLSKLYPTLNG